MHVEALERAGLAPAALIDADPECRAALRRRWPAAVVATSPTEVLDAFDVAIVAVPDLLHPSVTIELLQADKDVLVEKVMAGTRAEADAMVAAARATGRLLAVAHVGRHLAVKSWAFDQLRSGVLGHVERVDASQGGRDDWTASSSGYVDQAAGGVIAGQGAHALDLLAWWFGTLAVVSCADDAHGGHEANATIELVTGNVPIHLELSRIRSNRNTIRVHTERGLLEVALDHYQPRQLLAVPDGLDIEPFTEPSTEPSTDPHTGTVDDLAGHFDRQLRAFTDALDGRWSPRLATGVEGAAVAALLEDCYVCRTPAEPWWMASATTRS